MEKPEFLLKDIQDLKSDTSSNFTSQPPQQVSKETRFASIQFTPATTWSNCVGKAQNMLRGNGNGQESAGWFHFHKVASSGHEIFNPPLDMQQVYYQGLPEIRNNCYAQPDPRSQYPQPPPLTSFTDLRPPSQVVNQRFIQCVNHFAPGSRSLPCLLQPSYYGYEFGGPVQSGSDTLLTRVEPCDMSRSQRFPLHHDWINHNTRSYQDQNCYRQPWDSDQTCQPSFLSRFQENQTRKNKTYDCQEPNKSRDKNSAAFSYLAAEVSREMHWIIATGGHTLSDLLDFCKFVQSFLFISAISTSQRTQMIREIILSFIHISSAYVHIGSVLLMGEQNGMAPSEIENLRTSFNLWENAATSVVMGLRTLIHSISDIRIPDNKKMQDTEDQSLFKSDSSFPNHSFGDGFRFPNTSSSRNQLRNEFNVTQPFEFKRKYQSQSGNSCSQKESSSSFSNSSLNIQKTSCMNFKTKSCNQLNIQNTNSNNSTKIGLKRCEQHCNSPDSSSDSDKLTGSDSHDIKNFCFNLLNNEKFNNKKNKGKMYDHERQEQSSSRNKSEYLERPRSDSSKECKDTNKEKNDNPRMSYKPTTQQQPDGSQTVADSSSGNHFPFSSQSKIEDWSFGVLNTGDKKPFQFNSKSDLSKSDSKHSLFNNLSNASNEKETAEKPMSSDGEASPTGRFSNPELNKALEEHCEAARTQLKHKMLDILGFLQTSDTDCGSPNDQQINEMKKDLQESLNRISYLVYTDRYRGVGEMINAVRQLLKNTRIQNLNNATAVRLADDLESSFLDLFKKEFGCCGILYPQSTEK